MKITFQALKKGYRDESGRWKGKLEAIKAARNLGGLGLKDAKEGIEGVIEGTPFTFDLHPRSPFSSDTPEEILAKVNEVGIKFKMSRGIPHQSAKVTLIGWETGCPKTDADNPAGTDALIRALMAATKGEKDACRRAVLTEFRWKGVVHVHYKSCISFPTLKDFQEILTELGVLWTMEYEPTTLMELLMEEE